MLPEFDPEDRTRTDAWKILLYIITAYLRAGGEAAGNAKNDIEIELSLQSNAVDARLDRLKEIDLIETVPYPSYVKVDGRKRRVKPTPKAMNRYREYSMAMYHAILHFAEQLNSFDVEMPRYKPKSGDEFIDVLPNGVSEIVFDDVTTEEAA